MNRLASVLALAALLSPVPAHAQDGPCPKLRVLTEDGHAAAQGRVLAARPGAKALAEIALDASGQACLDEIPFPEGVLLVESGTRRGMFALPLKKTGLVPPEAAALSGRLQSSGEKPVTPQGEAVLEGPLEFLGKAEALPEALFLRRAPLRGGAFEFSGLPPGGYRLKIDSPNLLRRFEETLTLRPGERMTRIFESSLGGVFFRGSARDPEGRPVTGLLAALYPPVNTHWEWNREYPKRGKTALPRSIEETETAADGSFSFAQALRAEDKLTLVLWSEGSAPMLVPIERESMSLTWKPERRPRRLRLLDARGEPLKNIDVLLHPLMSDGKPWTASMRDFYPEKQARRFVTDAEGRAALPPIREGRYRLNLEERGFFAPEGFYVTLAGQEETVLRLPSGFDLRSQVADEYGAPIAGAEINAAVYDEATGKTTRLKAFTNAEGRFALSLASPSLPEETLHVKAEGYAPDSFLFHSLPPVFMLRRAGHVRGRVKNENGGPVVSFHISLTQKDYRDAYVRDDRNEDIQSLEGLFELKNVFPAAHRLSLTAPGYLSESRELEIKSGETLETEWTLRPGAGLDITLRDEQGLPVGGVSLTLRLDKDADGKDPSPGVIQKSVSDSGGMALFDGLPGGRYRVSARHPDYATAAQDVEVAPREEAAKTMQTIVMDGGCALRGRLFDSKGSPTPGALLLLYSQEKQTGWRRADTGADGSFAFEHVPPGRHAITTMRTSPSGRWEIDLDCENNAPLELKPEGHDVCGALLWDGILLTKPFLTVLANGTFLSSERESGRYCFQGLPPKSQAWTTLWDAPSGKLRESVTYCLELPVDDSRDVTHDIDFHLCEIRGRVPACAKPGGPAYAVLVPADTPAEAQSADMFSRTHARTGISPAGEFYLPVPFTGSFRLYVISMNGDTLASEAVTLSPGASLTLELDAPCPP